MGRFGRDAVAGAVNAGKSGGAGLCDLVDVAALIVFAAQSTCSAGPVTFRRQPAREAPS